jgi:hypothetical protein
VLKIENNKNDYLLVDADFRSLQMCLAFADCALNDDGIDQIAYDIYGSTGNNDAHSVTGYSTFCEPVKLGIIEVTNDDGSQVFFGETQKIRVLKNGTECVIIGNEFDETCTFLEYEK